MHLLNVAIAVDLGLQVMTAVDSGHHVLTEAFAKDANTTERVLSLRERAASRSLS